MTMKETMQIGRPRDVFAEVHDIRSLKLARSIARGMVKGVFGWALRRRRQNAARRAKAEKEA